MSPALHLTDASLKFVGLAGIDVLLGFVLCLEAHDPIAYLAALQNGGNRVFAPDSGADCPTDALRRLGRHETEYAPRGVARKP
jgi:hypothetical protein